MMSTAKERPRPRLQQIDRQQLIPEAHEERAIWEFVGQLDLSRYYEDLHAVEGVAGRETIAPRLLISLWVYSYCPCPMPRT